MVAYTSPDCLPYLTSGDSFCETLGPSVCDQESVWCRFAEGVDAVLTELDEVASQTVASNPIAWVENTAGFAYVVGSGEVLVPFDAVRVDTDNMVDLSTLPYGFAFNTPGLYQVWAYLQGTNDPAPAGLVQPVATLRLLPRSVTYGAFTPNEMEIDYMVPSAAASATLAYGGQHVMPITVPRTLQLAMTASGTSGDVITYTKISVGAARMGELP